MQWYNDLENLMKQHVPKEKPRRINPKKKNPLSNDDWQSEYQFIVNLTRVNKISSEFHKLLWYGSISTWTSSIIDSKRLGDHLIPIVLRVWVWSLV